MQDERGAQILAKLHEGGGRITRPRKMIVDVMLSADEHHLTAADIDVAALRPVVHGQPQATFEVGEP